MLELLRRCRLFAGLCFVVLGASGARLAAQTVITVPLQQCVWRAGDSPAWAAANLDESGWQPYTQWQLLPDEPRIWLRCHADLGSIREAAHPAVQVTLAAAYQVFVNGMRIGGAGNVSSGFFGMNTIRQYALPAGPVEAQPDTIALRITTRQPLNSTNPLKIHAGDMEALTGRRASFVLAQSSRALRVCFWYPLIGVAGLMLLGLFYYDRSRLELLWLCIQCVAKAALGIRAYCGAALMNYPWALHSAVMVAADFAAPIAFVLFPFALARRRVPRLYWLALAVVSGQWFFVGVTLFLSAGQSVQLTNLLNNLTLNLVVAVASLAFSTAPFVAFWPYRQISRRMRPLAAFCMVDGACFTVWFAVQITADPRLRLPDLWAHWQRGLLEVGAICNGMCSGGFARFAFPRSEARHRGARSACRRDAGGERDSAYAGASEDRDGAGAEDRRGLLPHARGGRRFLSLPGAARRAAESAGG